MGASAEERGGRAAVLAAHLVLCALVLATFGRIVGYGYVGWDDHQTIFENPNLQPVSLDTLADAWTKPFMEVYLPVTHSVWAFVASIAARPTEDGWLVRPLPFRLLSLLLHAASTAFVFAIVHRLVGKRLPALVGAAAFAVHPIQTEAVAWISGQKDLLAGLLTLASCHAALSAAAARRERMARWLLTAWLTGALAMLAKPQAVVAPGIVLLLMLAAGSSRRLAWGLTASLLVPAAIVAIVARVVQPAALVPAVEPWARPLVALDAIGWYATKLLLPHDFALDYGRTPGVTLWTGTFWTCLSAGVCVCAAALLLRRREPLIASGLLVAIVAVLPVLGLVPFSFQYYSTVSDHYLYTAMLGIALLVAAVAARVPPRLLGISAALVVVLLAVLAFRQASVWANTDRLFQHNLAVNPVSFAANRVLAYQATRRGDDRAAVALLDAALRVHPRDPIAHFNRANALARLGDVEAAERSFRSAIEADPRPPAGYRHNYAVLLIRQGRLDAAERQLEAAVQADPTATPSIEALARLRAMRQR